MHVVTRRGWEIAESQVTPEHLVLSRRTLLAGAALAGIAATRRRLGARGAAQPANTIAGRAITAEDAPPPTTISTSSAPTRSIYRAAQRLPISPWPISIEGMVDKPRTIDLDDLLKQVKLEERIYRHRCVEAWAMTVPWTGFPMRELVRLANPTAPAKYIAMETLADPKTMPGLRRSSQSTGPISRAARWPRRTTSSPSSPPGMYGKAMPKQDGAPIRLVVPWKYGFKSIKSIVRFNFTDKQPVNFVAADAAGRIRVLGQREPGGAASALEPGDRAAARARMSACRRKIYNGYGAQVAALYAGMPADKLFM